MCFDEELNLRVRELQEIMSERCNRSSVVVVRILEFPFDGEGAHEAEVLLTLLVQLCMGFCQRLAVSCVSKYSVPLAHFDCCCY